MGPSRRRAFFDGVFVGFSCVSLLLISVTLISKCLLLSMDGLEMGQEADESVAEQRNIWFLQWSYTSPLAVIAPRPQAEDEDDVREGDGGYIGGIEEGLEEVANATAAGEATPGVSDASVTGDTRYHPEKKTFITIIVSSVSLMEKTARIVWSTWGKEGSSDYRIFVGSSGVGLRNLPFNVVQFNHNDFPSFVYLSREELAFILTQMREAFLDSYKWFLIVPSNTYVSTHHMTQFLLGLDPDEVIYMGYPSNHTLEEGGHYCKAGPGLVLSHAALMMMEGKMEKCLREMNRRQSDVALGGCFMEHLQTECYIDPNVSS